eukprot:2477175-Pleurochrysis_carterae.AAC.1
MGSISTPATHAGVVTSSSRATPRGAICSAPAGRRPSRCARSLLACHARASAGSGCSASNIACFACTHAAISVEMRSNLFGA